METTYEKTEDGNLKEIIPQPVVEVTYEHDFLVQREAYFVAELKKVRDLLAKCDDLGIKPSIEEGSIIAE